MSVTIIQLQKLKSVRNAEHLNLKSWRSSDLLWRQAHRCAIQAAERPSTRAAIIGTRLREKGSTHTGPRYVNTPMGTRMAVASRNLCKASSTPRSPAVITTSGIDKLNQ